MMTKQSMNIDPYEKNWIRLSIGLLIAFAVAVSVAGFAMGIQVPSPEQRVDPNTVALAGPWANPGLRTIQEGKKYSTIRCLGLIWLLTLKKTLNLCENYLL